MPKLTKLDYANALRSNNAHGMAKAGPRSKVAFQVYTPAPYAIARAEGNDYLRYPCNFPGGSRYFNIQAGSWQDTPVGAQ